MLTFPVSGLKIDLPRSGLVKPGTHRLTLGSVDRRAAGRYVCQVQLYKLLLVLRFIGCERTEFLPQTHIFYSRFISATPQYLLFIFFKLTEFIVQSLLQELRSYISFSETTKSLYLHKVVIAVYLSVCLYVRSNLLSPLTNLPWNLIGARTRYNHGNPKLSGLTFSSKAIIDLTEGLKVKDQDWVE